MSAVKHLSLSLSLLHYKCIRRIAVRIICLLESTFHQAWRKQQLFPLKSWQYSCLSESRRASSHSAKTLKNWSNKINGQLTCISSCTAGTLWWIKTFSKIKANLLLSGVNYHIYKWAHAVGKKKDISFQLSIAGWLLFLKKELTGLWRSKEMKKDWKPTRNQFFFFSLNQLFHPDENKTKGSNPKA